MSTQASAEPWTPPAELGCDCPRAVRLTGSGKAVIAFSILLVLGAACCGAFLIRASQHYDEERALLERQGVRTTATIVDYHHAEKSKSCRVAYSFVYAGREYHNETWVPDGIGLGVRPGDSLPILVLPARPTLNHPAAWRRAGLPIGIAYAAMLGMAAVAGLMLLPMRSQRRLLAVGRAAPGRIIRSVAIRNQYRYVYEFRLADGAAATGGARFNRAMAIGAPVCVLYDTGHPNRNGVYPFSLICVDSSLRQIVTRI
jgi:hypothetical protein